MVGALKITHCSESPRPSLHMGSPQPLLKHLLTVCKQLLKELTDNHGPSNPAGKSASRLSDYKWKLHCQEWKNEANV